MARVQTQSLSLPWRNWSLGQFEDELGSAGSGSPGPRLPRGLQAGGRDSGSWGSAVEQGMQLRRGRIRTTQLSHNQARAAGLGSISGFWFLGLCWPVAICFLSAVKKGGLPGGGARSACHGTPVTALTRDLHGVWFALGWFSTEEEEVLAASADAGGRVNSSGELPLGHTLRAPRMGRPCMALPTPLLAPGTPWHGWRCACVLDAWYPHGNGVEAEN